VSVPDCFETLESLEAVLQETAAQPGECPRQPPQPECLLFEIKRRPAGRTKLLGLGCAQRWSQAVLAVLAVCRRLCWVDSWHDLG
jgi:hypothetical protein